jgi:hypothetical protein
MTLEQMLTISKLAAAVCAAIPYSEPKLENGVWTVGFWPDKADIALQVDFPDREIKTDKDLGRAEIDLVHRMRGVILMSR